MRSMLPLLFLFFVITFCSQKFSENISTKSTSSIISSATTTSTTDSSSSSSFKLPWQMINYLEPEELAQLIKEETESVLIIDVRDHDYEVSF